MDNLIKGLEYEKQVILHLLKSNKLVFGWNDIPIDVFIQSKIFENYSDKLNFRRKSLPDVHGVPDTGCDVYYFDEQHKRWVIVQCKNYTGTVTLDKLAGFYGMLLSTELHGELFYTSSLSEPITRYSQKKIKYIKHPYIDDNTKIIQENRVRLQPYNYQTEAINTMVKHQRGIMVLACGLGKTLISIHWAERFNVVIIFSPLMPHAKQNLERFKNEYHDAYEYILVDSDGTRNINEIIPHLNQKVVLSVTYKSHDVINNLINYIPDKNNIGIVIDEFHNLTCDNLMNKDDSFYKIFEQEYNFLFVSATPKIYDTDNDDYLDNFTVTGKVEYEYELGKAIQEKLICDYDVFVPDISITPSDQLIGVYEYLDIKDLSNIDNDVKAHFLLRGMEENGHSKCICYSKDIEDTKQLNEAFNRIKKYHALELYIETIISDTKQKEREKILKGFSETKKKALICSVRILDECIDIPKCDSVFITSTQTNKIRTIQRVCRANRKDPSNPNKRSGIYMWTNENEQITELIANLKEFDSTFTIDKVKICNISDNKKLCVKPRQEQMNIEIYKSLDKVLISTKRVETWSQNFDNAKKHINENKCRPSEESEDLNIKRIAKWIAGQNIKYKNKTGIMINQNIYSMWSQFLIEFKIYFPSAIEKWNTMHDKIDKYIDENKCIPDLRSQNIEIQQMGLWIANQKYNHQRKQNIHKNEEIYNKWEQLVTKYDDIVLTKEDKREKMFKKFKQHLDENKCIPYANYKNKEFVKLAHWYVHQQNSYEEKINCMKNDKIYNQWSEFIIEYKNKLIDNHQLQWNINFNKLKEYIDTNKCIPNYNSKDSEVKKLYHWMATQKKYYKNKSNCMKSIEMYNIWTKITEDYINKYSN